MLAPKLVPLVFFYRIIFACVHSSQAGHSFSEYHIQNSDTTQDRHCSHTVFCTHVSRECAEWYKGLVSVYMADSRLIRFAYLFSGHSYKEWILGQIQLNKLANLNIFVTSLQPPFCFSCCEEAIRLGYIASGLCVSPVGKHISLVICVQGNIYQGETHITVTPGLTFRIRSEHLEFGVHLWATGRHSLTSVERPFYLLPAFII